MHGHFYGNFTGNLAHAQSVCTCTGPFSRGEGPGDEANVVHTRGTRVGRSHDQSINQLAID